MSIAAEIYIGVYLAGFTLGLTYIAFNCLTQLTLYCLKTPIKPQANDERV